MPNKQIYFRTLQDAEEYWFDNFGGQHKDPDVEIAEMERWLECVIIAEVEDANNETVS